MNFEVTSKVAFVDSWQQGNLLAHYKCEEIRGVHPEKSWTWSFDSRDGSYWVYLDEPGAKFHDIFVCRINEKLLHSNPFLELHGDKLR